MTITNLITVMLDITPENYTERYIARYMEWLIKYAIKDAEGFCPVDFQKLLANAAINDWYTRHHEQIEMQAIEAIKYQFQTITIDKVRDIYALMMGDVYLSYPKPLFDAARKLTIINPPTYDPSAN